MSAKDTPVLPQVPIDYTNLKFEVRKGLPGSRSRFQWWPVLSKIEAGSSIDKYPDVTGPAERLSIVLREPLLDAKSQQHEEGINELEYISMTTHHLMYVLKKSNLLNMDDEHTFYRWQPLLRLLVCELKRIDICYLIISDLLHNQQKYLEVGYEAHTSLLATFRDTLSSFMPKTFKALSGMGALDDRYLDLMFVGLFTEILPPEYVLRMIGSFLLEGVKILFRYGLALIRGYKGAIKSGMYTTASEFWLSVKADAIAYLSGPDSISVSVGGLMLYKVLGLEDGLDPVDPFVLFSKAKNRDFLNSNKLLEYSFDIDRSALDKIRRPMNVSSQVIRESIRRESLSSASGNGTSMAASPSSSTASHSPTRSASSASSSYAGVGGVGGSGSGGGGPRPAKRVGSVTEMVSNVDSSSVLQRRGSARGGGPAGRMGVERSDSRDSRGSGGTPTRLGRALSRSYDEADGGGNGIRPSSASSEAGSFAVGGIGIAISDGNIENKTEAQAEDQIEKDKDLELAAAHLQTTSTILHSDPAMAHRLLSFLPLDPYDVKALKLVFSTDLHGYNLSSLYTNSAGGFPLVLLVRLAGGRRGAVLGAYMATPLTVATSSTRLKKCGDSSTRCFRLDVPNAAVFTTVLSRRSADSHHSSPGPDRGAESDAMLSSHGELTTAAATAAGERDNLELDIDSIQIQLPSPAGAGGAAGTAPAPAVDGALQAALGQFVVATREYLSVGCSQLHGSAALRLDEDLQLLSTGPSDTFGNPSLVRADDDNDGAVEAQVRSESELTSYPIEAVELLCVPTRKR